VKWVKKDIDLFMRLKNKSKLDLEF